MKSRALCLAVLLLASCRKTEAPKQTIPPPTSISVPASKAAAPAGVASPASASAPSSAPGSAASAPASPATSGASSAPASADMLALAEALLCTGTDVIAYSAGEGRFAYAVSYQEEGMGEGCDVYFAGPGKAEDSVSIYDPGDNDGTDTVDKRRASHRDEIAAKLTAGKYQRLDGIAWPEKAKSLALPSVSAELQWKGTTATLTPKSGAASKVNASMGKPWTPAPQAVYAAAGVPFVVLRVLQDPGSAYGEGMNVVTEYKFLALP